MIDPTQFHAAWEGLCTRFGKEPDPRQAGAYLRYLSEQMTTEQFIQSVRALWATAKWFPRPADFLLIATADDWQIVMRCMDECKPPEWNWSDIWREEMNERARAACLALGGIQSMRPMRDKDIIRLKAAWESAYEQAAASAALALPAPNRAKEIAPTLELTA